MKLVTGIWTAIRAVTGAVSVADSQAAPVRSPQAVRHAGEIPTIYGAPGDDEIVGTMARDVIVDLGGNDVINEGDSSDKLCG
jgi:hypothetical protein